MLPFEISAACNIIHYWPGSEGINNSAWIVPLLVALVAIQFFGVRGYGEVSVNDLSLHEQGGVEGDRKGKEQNLLKRKEKKRGGGDEKTKSKEQRHKNNQQRLT